MGQLTLPSAARISIDTVTIIYAVEQAPTYGVLLNPWVVTGLPVVILDEVLTS